MTPSSPLPESALDISFMAAGESCSFTDGWVHHKTCPYAIIAEVLEGRYDVQVATRSASVGRGQAWLAPANVPLRITHHHGPHGNMAVRWVHFHATVYGAMDALSLLEPPLVLGQAVMAHVGTCIAGLLEAPELQRPIRAAARRKELGYTIFRAVCEVSPPAPHAADILRGAGRLAPVYRYVREHQAEPLTLAELARVANLSPSRFHAVFRELAGMSPMNYVKRARLEEARRMLCSTDLPIARVADLVGFANQFHFAREFRTGFGQTPSAFRQTHGGLVA